MRLIGPLLLLASAVPLIARGDPQPDKPQLNLRASPRMSFSPVSIVSTAELEGGEDVEEYYCPGLEWDWGDGSRSARESDCAPFETGAALARRFTARHVYRSSGSFEITITLRRASRTIARARTSVMVRPGLGN
jgi:hypothetical protein